jgi:multiple sugar transport system ATP-binding protein
VVQAANILGIETYLDRKPKALSGGQRQRVAIGRAIVREPQVFLMDEPLSNLDAKLRNQMRAEIILLRQRLDTTFVYVTHDQTEAMTLGDRIVIMKDGFIQQVGTPQEVFEHPRNLFVAGFIGSPRMNILSAKLVKDGPGYSLKLPGMTLQLDEEQCAKLRERKSLPEDVTMGVRPEHTHLKFDDPANAIECTLAVNEMMGSELHLHALTESGQTIILRVPTMDLSDSRRSTLKAGNKLYFSFPSKVVHLFDPKTEESLLY